MIEALDVVAIKYGKDGVPECVLLNNDEVLAVTNCYDSDGNNLFSGDDLWDLTWLVAGPSAEGHWFTVEVAEYTETATTQ